MDTVRFTAFRITQPLGDFFVASLPAYRLRTLAQADMRRITQRDIEERSGIQRSLNRARLKEIGQYIKTVDASFPNSIILNLRSANIVSAVEHVQPVCGDTNRIFCFEILPAENAFQIIDGQHRLVGFQDVEVENFDLIIAFFVDLSVEDQAYMFSTINLTQTKVNKSLVYDLFEVSETRSPQRTAHLIAKSLNADEDSPFYRRLKLLGVMPTFEGELLYRAPLSQGTFVDRLLRLISRDPMKDRDAEKRQLPIALDGRELDHGLIFRRFYVESKDWAILRVLKNYFSAVRESFPVEWSDLDSPLAKTIGYGALMRLLVDLYREGVEAKDVSGEFFQTRLDRTAESYRRSGRKMTFAEFPAAGAGEVALYNQLLAWSRDEMAAKSV